MEQPKVELSLCDCKFCGNYDVVEPFTVCEVCGNDDMQPVDDPDAFTEAK